MLSLNFVTKLKSSPRLQLNSASPEARSWAVQVQHKMVSSAYCMHLVDSGTVYLKSTT